MFYKYIHCLCSTRFLLNVNMICSPIDTEGNKDIYIYIYIYLVQGQYTAVASAKVKTIYIKLNQSGHYQNISRGTHVMTSGQCLRHNYCTYCNSYNTNAHYISCLIVIYMYDCIDTQNPYRYQYYLHTTIYRIV